MHKARYVAQIEIEMDYTDEQLREFEFVENQPLDELADLLRRVIREEFTPHIEGFARNHLATRAEDRVGVTQLFADVWEAKDE